MSATPLTVTAPAKINLYLRVTGRRETGYHELDSLVVFADVADEIKIAPATEFSFDIDGPYASGFTGVDRNAGSTSGNLVVRAAYACAEYFGKPLLLHLTLIKNLPLSSGIGGGSADAAAVVWGLIRFWKLTPPPRAALMPLLLGLGADVPVCYLSHTTHMRGIGEILSPVDLPHEYPAVLVNPGVSCATPAVFRRYYELGTAFSIPQLLPDVSAREELISYLAGQANDLEASSISLYPVIGDVLTGLRATRGVRYVRMCGSGATCLALYDTEADAHAAASLLQEKRPDWWVRACVFNRIARY